MLREACWRQRAFREGERCNLEAYLFYSKIKKQGGGVKKLKLYETLILCGVNKEGVGTLVGLNLDKIFKKAEICRNFNNNIFITKWRMLFGFKEFEFFCKKVCFHIQNNFRNASEMFEFSCGDFLFYNLYLFFCFFFFFVFFSPGRIKHMRNVFIYFIFCFKKIFDIVLNSLGKDYYFFIDIFEEGEIFKIVTCVCCRHKLTSGHC